jgi:hypothetical protein
MGERETVGSNKLPRDESFAWTYLQHREGASGRELFTQSPHSTLKRETANQYNGPDDPKSI